MTMETKTEAPPPAPISPDHMKGGGTSFQGGFARGTLSNGAQAWFSLIGSICLGVGVFYIGGLGWLMVYCGLYCFACVVGSKMK